jgi:hypothetical protein
MYIMIFCHFIMLENIYIMLEKFDHIYSRIYYAIMLGNFPFRI